MPMRWWRLGPWSRNRLMRRGDRLEAVIMLLAAVLMVMLVPFAAAYGTATHTRLEQQAQALRRRASGARGSARGRPARPRQNRCLAPFRREPGLCPRPMVGGR
ncbi:hypothetical membrane protein (plasmid) [Rhodococcus opacus B4]|uniref:Hypothetical membrane protein n=1 Tax=Rhodococcus opacus (strain B4) TaxID=632772 RepID=C1BDA7_RHOOB|nr:hypothetical membrane protein [Rhodococcus opacus B4]